MATDSVTQSVPSLSQPSLVRVIFTLPFKVCPAMLLEAIHCMSPIFEGVASKVWPESVTLNSTLKVPTPGNLMSKDPVKGVSPVACSSRI